MTQSLLIVGGQVFDGSTMLGVADVLVAEGCIAAVGTDLRARHGDARSIDAEGCIVSPGFVDLHTHLREPGFEHKGTIASETAAAARGGFTTLCAMPNTEPPPDSAPEVESLLGRIRRDAAVRVFPIGCVTRRRDGKEIADLGELAASGCVAFSDDGSPVADSGIMRRALEILGNLGLPLSEHSEDPAIRGNGVMHEGAVSERLGLPGESGATESVAIARNIALAELTGAHLHIAHISTRRSVELVAEAKARGVRVTAEVTPSHLFLTDAAVFGGGDEPAYDTNARINPPLRTEDDRRALVQGLADGTIDVIATDHAPHAIVDKQCEFEDAAPGISCLETALATVLTLVERGELPLERALAALTSRPAAVFALDRRVPGLGTLVKGGPADLAIIDPALRWTVDPRAFVSLGKNSPLGGVELAGQVRATLVAGKLVFGDAGSMEGA